MPRPPFRRAVSILFINDNGTPRSSNDFNASAADISLQTFRRKAFKFRHFIGLIIEFHRKTKYRRPGDVRLALPRDGKRDRSEACQIFNATPERKFATDTASLHFVLITI